MSSAARALAALLVMLFTLRADLHASFLSEEAEDTLATIIALFVIFVVPIVLIVLFWMVHILPEKIAHRRHHPQFEAIRTLCLLSLVFGGLLWPIAWIWAYTKPVIHKLAYGTDKASHAVEEEGTAWDASSGSAALALAPTEAHAEVVGLSERLARLEEHGVSTNDLKVLHADLDALEARLVAHEVR
jgi:hypothetical protein